MSKELPAVSIILPIYNAGNLLCAQVDSILAQTYPQLELLLVDDGSMDESPDIAQEYADRYHFIHFRRNEVNQGLLATVNEVMKHATGDLIAFSDHDDVWVRDKTARQVDYLVAHPEVVCVFSDRMVMDLEGRELCASEYKRIGTPPEITDTPFLLSSMARYTHANTLMFRRKLIDFIFPIPRGWDWWIGCVASWFGSVGFMHEQLVQYRVYEGSVSSNQRLYLPSRSHTTRAQVRANTQRHFDYVTSLRERAQQLAGFNPPLPIIEQWWHWYGLLLELLTCPTLQAYRHALALLPVIGNKRELFKVTLYALPVIHRVYLRLAAQWRGY